MINEPTPLINLLRYRDVCSLQAPSKTAPASCPKLRQQPLRQVPFLLLLLFPQQIADKAVWRNCLLLLFLPCKSFTYFFCLNQIGSRDSVCRCGLSSKLLHGSTM